MKERNENEQGIKYVGCFILGMIAGAIVVGLMWMQSIWFAPKYSESAGKGDTSEIRKDVAEVGKDEIKSKEVQVDEPIKTLSREEEIKMFSVKFEVEGEVPFDKTIISPDDGRRRGYFDHALETGDLDEMLLDNYGSQVGEFEVQDKDGNFIKIKDMKEEGKALALSFGRPTCPFCVDLWHRLDEEGEVEGLKIVNLTTEGLPSEINAFLKEEKLESEFDNFYYNVAYLQNILEVKYVPVIFYLNDDFTVVNVSDGLTPKETMEQIVKDIPHMNR